jgi:hypothetical protein
LEKRGRGDFLSGMISIYVVDFLGQDTNYTEKNPSTMMAGTRSN